MQKKRIIKRPTGKQTSIFLDLDARRFLEEQAPSHKLYGQYVSRLLIAEQARIEERERLRQVSGDDAPVVQ